MIVRESGTRMSRRKQAKPQHVESDLNLTSPENMDDAYHYFATPAATDSHPLPDHTHVCRRCCAEFTEFSDLEEHHRDCSPDQLVLIVNEKEESSYAEMFSVGSLSPSTPGEQSETVNNFEMEEIDNLPEERMEESEESMDFVGCKSSHGSLDRPSSASSSTSNGSSTESTTDNVLCTSALPASLPQPGNPPEQGPCSWTNSNVVIENLESTKVAVAQFSQLNGLDLHSCSNSKMSVSSLMEQLLGLQLQQIHQLQMIDQIRHQVLLFASQRLEISETPPSCPQDTTSSRQTNQLKTLSSHLSQQLATAAGLAQSLTSQSASIGHFKRLTATVQLPQSNPNGEVALSSSEPLKSMGKRVTTTASKQLSRKQSTFASSLYPQLSFLAQTKLSCQALGTDSFQKLSNNSTLPQPSSSNQTAANSIPSISGIMEDLSALTALTQQKKGKSANITVFQPKSSSREAFFKHKCRFCAKVFGSDSALQIHLRSHTGERPYKCNICGNRFSTRGNLKVHFQRHKERYPHIQMNPYPVPEHLDNIPTSTGIPYGMSMPLEKPVTCWLDSKPPLTNLTTSAGLLLSSASPKRLSLIKKEEQQVHVTTPSSQGVGDFGAKKTVKSTDFAETRNSALPTLNPKSEDPKLPLNLASKMNTKIEGSSESLITAIQSIGTNPNKMEQFKAKYPFGGTHPVQTSETSKLQRLVENIDKTVSDPNECIICHRILSCQSALKMHYRTHTGERPYRCRVCGRSFSTKGNLKTHHAVHRATPPLRVQHSCPICQRKFTNAMVLQQHVRMHTGGQIPNVPLLDQSYLKSMESEDLEKFCDDDDDMEDTTDRGIRGKSRFNFSSGHLSPLSSANMGAGSFDAPKTCHRGLVGDRQGNWLKTEGLIEESNQVYNPSSLRGPETTKLNRSLSPHKNASVHCNLSGIEDSYHTHVNSRPLQLNSTTGIASIDLKPLNQLKDPSDMILRERGIFRNTACDICGKTFACQSALDIHYRSHTKERPFICTACSRGFSTKGNLKQHMLTHQMRDLPSQLFEPSNTGLASSPNPSVLSMGSPIAIKLEANGFLNTSSSYGKGRDLSGSLRSSSTSASPIAVATPPPRRTPKQHYCQTCGKTFSSSSALQIHERTHTGEKPFACTVCGRAFTTKGNLKVHMGTHMWNSTPTRRGSRMSVEGPLTFMGTHSVKLPEPPQRDTGVRSSNGESLYFWTQYTDSLSKTMTTRTNDVSVIQTGGVPYLSGPVGQKGSSTAGDIAVSLNKLHHKDHNKSLIMLGKTTVERRNFSFTRLIEERKEMIAN